MSLAADEQDNWRGSYDAWKTTDPREVPNALPLEACSICGGRTRDRRGFLACHTAQERGRAYRKRMGWELPDDGG